MPSWPIEARCAAVSVTSAGIGYLTTLSLIGLLVTFGCGLILVGLLSDRRG